MNADCAKGEKLVHAWSDPSGKRKGLRESAVGLLETSAIDASQAIIFHSVLSLAYHVPRTK
jgi:hypothetical protein